MPLSLSETSPSASCSRIAVLWAKGIGGRGLVPVLRIWDACRDGLGDQLSVGNLDETFLAHGRESVPVIEAGEELPLCEDPKKGQVHVAVGCLRRTLLQVRCLIPLGTYNEDQMSDVCSHESFGDVKGSRSMGPRTRWSREVKAKDSHFDPLHVERMHDGPG